MIGAGYPRPFASVIVMTAAPVTMAPMPPAPAPVAAMPVMTAPVMAVPMTVVPAMMTPPHFLDLRLFDILRCCKRRLGLCIGN